MRFLVPQENVDGQVEEANKWICEETFRCLKTRRGHPFYLLAYSQCGAAVKIGSGQYLYCLFLFFPHFAHGEDWEDSVSELSPLLSSRSWRTIVVGDLDIEGRDAFQSSGERFRWHHMVEQFCTHGLAYRELRVGFTRLGYPHDS